MKPPALRVEGSGSAWAIWDGDQLVSITAHHDRALDQIESLLRRRRQAPRICLSCDRPFLSDGPHNRLCPKCRRG